MVLAEPRGGVAVVQQDAADGGLVLGDDAVVAREAGGLLGDHAEAGRVMVAPGDQRGARRRAERGGVDVVVAQTVLRDAIHRRRRDDAAEGARHAEARVVGHDEQDVGRLLGRHDARRPPGFGLQGVVLDHAAELRVGRRELLAVDGGGGAGRTRHAGDLRAARGACRTVALRHALGLGDLLGHGRHGDHQQSGQQRINQAVTKDILVLMGLPSFLRALFH